jgi:hypothetical protein
VTLSTPRRCPTTPAGRHPRQELTAPHRQLRFPAEAAMSQGASAPQPSAPLLPASPRCQAAAAARRGHGTRRCRPSTAGPPGWACQAATTGASFRAEVQPPLRRRRAEPPLEVRHTTWSGSIADSTPPLGDEDEDATRETPPAAGHARALPGSGPWRRRGSGGRSGGDRPPPVSPRVGRRGGGERFPQIVGVKSNQGNK